MAHPTRREAIWSIVSGSVGLASAAAAIGPTLVSTACGSTPPDFLDQSLERYVNELAIAAVDRPSRIIDAEAGYNHSLGQSYVLDSSSNSWRKLVSRGMWAHDKDTDTQFDIDDGYRRKAITSLENEIESEHKTTDRPLKVTKIELHDPQSRQGATLWGEGYAGYGVRPQLSITVENQDGYADTIVISYRRDARGGGFDQSTQPTEWSQSLNPLVVESRQGNIANFQDNYGGTAAEAGEHGGTAAEAGEQLDRLLLPALRAAVEIHKMPDVLRGESWIPDEHLRKSPFEFLLKGNNNLNPNSVYLNSNQAYLSASEATGR